MNKLINEMPEEKILEELKKIINYNTYRIDINEDIDELKLTKKQKQRIKEIISDILYKFKKMSYNKIDYIVIGNDKKHIVVDISIYTRSKIIFFAVEFKGKEENIKYSIISDKATEFQEKLICRNYNRIYKRFVQCKNTYIILLEKSIIEEKIKNEITYFIVKELKNNFEIINLYSDKKIKLPREFKDEMLDEIKKLQAI